MQEGKRNREVFNEHEIALLWNLGNPLTWGGGEDTINFFSQWC